MISIIVPVYNSELYLAECLESIKNQTYKDFEVVLYNDGSTDNSKKICERFLHKDNRFKYYEQENQGPGTTRNNALKKASGDYICFVDSDDIVSEYYLERLYDAIVETDADISVCDLTRLSPSGFKILNKKPLILNKEDAITELIQERKLKNYSVCRLIKKNKIQNITFDTTKNEDVFFSLRLFKNINKTAVIDDKLYFYRINNQSITNQNNFEFEFNVLENYLKCNKILDNEEQIKRREILDRLLAVEICREETGFSLICVHTGSQCVQILRCRHLVLATGGEAGAYENSVYPPSQTGALGLCVSAGLSLCNLMHWQYGIASVPLRWNLSGSYQQVLPSYVSVDEAGVQRESRACSGGYLIRPYGCGAAQSSFSARSAKADWVALWRGASFL